MWRRLCQPPVVKSLKQNQGRRLTQPPLHHPSSDKKRPFIGKKPPLPRSISRVGKMVGRLLPRNYPGKRKNYCCFSTVARTVLIGMMFVKANGGMSIRGSPVGNGVVVVSGGKTTTGRPTGLFCLVAAREVCGSRLHLCFEVVEWTWREVCSVAQITGEGG